MDNVKSLPNTSIGLTTSQRYKFQNGGSLGFLLNLSQSSEYEYREGNDNTFDTNGQLELYYFNLSAEYLFYDKFPWQFSVVPFNVAFGSGHYEYVSHASGTRVNGPSEFLMTYQPDITAQYNILTWFGFGVTTGYRFTLYRSLEQTKALPGINFSVDFRLSIDELYYELRSSK